MIGKRLSIKKLRENQEFEKVSEVFLKDDVLPNEIIENGEKALLILYNYKSISINIYFYNDLSPIGDFVSQL